MKVRRAWLTEHRAPLPASVSSSRHTWVERQSLLLYLEDVTGVVGTGEVSPLPGYSTETLRQCQLALEHIDWGLDHPRGELPPAARFAVDTALLDLQSRRTKKPAWSLLTRDTPERISLCRMLQERDPAALRDEVAEAVETGFECFKLKIGSDSHVDLERARVLRQQAPNAEIRLDANRAWPRQRAANSLAPYQELACAFVEEPCADLVLTRDPDELTKLCESLPMPLALDESLQQPGALATVDFALQHAQLGALVAKPMALGGIEPVRQLRALAERHHVPVVLSHLLDGPLAWAGCAALALAFGSRTVAAGLGPHSGLVAWPTANLPGLQGAWLGPWSTPGVLP